MRKALFALHGGKPYVGYIGEFEPPYFTKEVAEQIMNDVNAPYNGHHIIMHYVAETDTFIYVVDDIIREFKGEDIGNQHLYGIPFMWDEVRV